MRDRKTLMGINLAIALLSSAFSVAAIGNTGALDDTDSITMSSTSHCETSASNRNRIV
jgi:hypothetical protein